MRIPLEPAPGLNGNDTKFSQQMRFTDASNVRWVGGRAETIGGWTREFPDQLDGVCRGILPWRDLDASLNIALGTHTKLYVYLGGLYDITPSGLAAGAEDSALGPGYGTGAYGVGDFGEGDASGYFARTWSLQNWGENLIASPRGGTIFLWENVTADLATAITDAPDQVTAVLVTTTRQVMALGCNEETSGQFNPMCIRYSKGEDYEEWTTSLTSAHDAGESILEAAGGGRIVSGRLIGPYVAVWTDQGLFLGEYINDADEIWRFTLIATNCGLIGPNAVAVVNQRAWWMTPDGLFYTWAPGEAPSLIPCPIRDDFKDNIAQGQGDKITAVGIGEFGEVWWHYPDSRDGNENSRYVSLNIAAQSLFWSRGTMERSACADAGSSPNPLFVSPDGYVYSHENGQTANGSALSWSLTISLPYLDEGGRFVLLKQLEPDFKDQVGAISVTFELGKYPQSDRVSKGPYTLSPGMWKKDFLMSGRVADITFSGNSAPTFARFGKPILLGEATGRE